MARAKTKYDVLNNQRKRIKRAIVRFEKIGTPEAERYANHLRENLQSTYLPKTKNIESRQKAYESAQRRLKEYTQNVQYEKYRDARILAQRNAIIKNEIRLASKGGKSFLGEYGEQKVKIFLRATQNIWNIPGVAPNQRFEAVMKALGVKDLKEAFEKVLAQNEEALKAAIADLKIKKDTKGLVDNEPALEGSPRYVFLVEMI